MDWSIQDLGSLGEFIASIGVIITLVYVGVQLRQNTAAVRASTMQSVFEVTNNAFQNNSQDLRRTEQFLEIAEKTDRSTAEHSFYVGFLMQPFRAQETIFYHLKHGTVDRSSVNLEKRVRATVTAPHMLDAWNRNIPQLFLSDEYIAFVDQILAKEELVEFDYSRRLER